MSRLRRPVTGVKRRRGWMWALPLLIGVLCLGVPELLRAQGGGAAPAAAPQPGATPAASTTAGDATTGGDPQAGRLPTFQELFNTSPVINTIILLLSVAAMLLFIYFLLTINTRSMMPAMFLDEVMKLTLAGRYDEAANFCRNERHLFCASILQRCFENADKDPQHLLTLIESEGQRRADLLWNRIGYLMDLSSLAPMLGLLGTVLGMLYAFFGLKKMGTEAGFNVLSQSIGGAMTATFLGIAVAIVAVVFHSIVKSRTVATLADVEQAVHSIADHITRQPLPDGGGDR